MEFDCDGRDINADRSTSAAMFYVSLTAQLYSCDFPIWPVHAFYLLKEESDSMWTEMEGGGVLLRCGMIFKQEHTG